MSLHNDSWIAATLQSLDSQRRMIDATVRQLSDSELVAKPIAGGNSVAILLRHLGGNLQSRWSDFLTADGEKPTRDRDSEFQDWDGDRDSLLQYFDSGWRQMINTISSLQPDDLGKTVRIRGEAHTVTQAMLRSLTHIAYHSGQIMIIARATHQGPWNWLTIPPGQSRQHNESTWGTSRSRGATGEES